LRGNSPTIQSAQDAPHRRLAETVERHLQHTWRQPIAEHSRRAFDKLCAWRSARASMPLVLDSGCGNGASTLVLAAVHSDCAVVGIDQSRARLWYHLGPVDDLAPVAGHAVVLRAPLQDVWRLLHAQGTHLHRHLLWYPNPWPKPEHLGRRWHAHPVFPTLLALGGELELRSNWRVYVDEFALALSAHGWPSAVAQVPESGEPATPFERKYRDSGHALWRLTASAPTTAGG
jgi:tRNA G46 methylase TrmB